ncbi:hypothetical protein GCM10028862_02310 [Luteimonas pelagia]
MTSPIASRRPARLAALGLMLAGSCHAGQAVHTDLFASDDAEDTQVLRAAVGWDFRFESPDAFTGLQAETVRIRPQGQATWTDERLYFLHAGTARDRRWRVRAGTDGETLLGSANLVLDRDLRHEYFAEREILETPLGVSRRLFHTFVGAAHDIPLSDDGRHQLATVAGVQDFTGDNTRVHLRARYIAVVAPEAGLSAQLRTRWFRDSTPREFDYYAPGWFAEAMPVLQVRRYQGGWRWSAAAGIGWQRDAASDTRQSRLFEATLTSPRGDAGSYFDATMVYTNTPSSTGAGYGYRHVQLSWILPF